MTHHHMTDRQLLEDIHERVCSLEQHIRTQGIIMSKAIDDLTQAVTEEKTAVDSAVTLINGIADQIATASNDPKVQDLANQVRASAKKLSDAVIANTPAATNPPAEPTNG